MTPILVVQKLQKSFTLHTQGGVMIDAVQGLDLTVAPGGCLVLTGPSGAGKSSVLRCVYGNYKPQSGSIRIRQDGAWIEMLGAEPRQVIEVRRRTMGFVSQFLRVIPRVPVIDLVAEPLLARGVSEQQARERAGEILTRLAVPERLWPLAPATFSGGEQQRVNIARAMILDYPLLLLDEPTASLDSRNRARVIELLIEARERGAAMLGIFHDAETREAVGTGELAMEAREKAA